MSKHVINVPVPFPGTNEEKVRNRNSHYWLRVDEYEYRCSHCDCKPWHVAADYPCGTEPPRMDKVCECQ